MSRKYYSTAFQMHEQRANFKGIDTCNISTYRQFHFNSSLLSKFEAVSIVNRSDINALLNQLVEEKLYQRKLPMVKELMHQLSQITLILLSIIVDQHMSLLKHACLCKKI